MISKRSSIHCNLKVYLNALIVSKLLDMLTMGAFKFSVLLDFYRIYLVKVRIKEK